jgi:antitoxin component of RelBE/YafQ-DinJ toxin-antitoxin module
MQAKTLINFSCSTEKKAAYTAACQSLGVSVSDVCRRALDNAVSLSEKLKTPKTEVSP